jgi:hypothetical protein
MAEAKRWKWGPAATWSLTAIASLAFRYFEGRGSMINWILVVSLSLSSFTIGALAGFLFTSYGEETSTVGKVRDWLIGGLTGLAIAKVGAIKSLSLTFAAGPGPQEFAVVTGTAVTRQFE